MTVQQVYFLFFSAALGWAVASLTATHPLNRALCGINAGLVVVMGVLVSTAV
jgi:hypothetical protein